MVLSQRRTTRVGTAVRMAQYVTLSYIDVAIAAVLLCINAGLSIALNLGLSKTLIFSAIRMTVQLLLIGLVLKALFALASPWLTLLVALIMGMVAGREIFARQETPLAGIWGWGIGATTMIVAGGIVTIFALTLQIRPDPWYTPRYALPLFGMILGNAMTGISLGLDTLTSLTRRERAAVEAQLMLGATRWQAMLPLTRRALSSGMMPSINAMAATGIVALPGMMTGQILAGIPPTEAVKYQLLVMFLIAGSTGLGVVGAVLATVWRITDDRHRLRLDRLAKSRS